MTDATLRELERAAPADTAAEERWIVARLRAGTLSEERLHVMRLLGHEGTTRLLARTHDPFLAHPGVALAAVAKYLVDRLGGPLETLVDPVEREWLPGAVTYAVELCALAQDRWHRFGRPNSPGGRTLHAFGYPCHDPICDASVRCLGAAHQWLKGSESVRPALFALSAMAGAPVGDSPATGPLWVWLPARLACGLSVENLPSLHGVCMDLGVQPQAMLDAARGPLIAWCLA